jgi:L-alanine-DL-glutamate epimerase-like enolase superfamily enzyme
MKIVEIEPFIVHVPLGQGIADSTNSIDHWGFAGVIIHADNGLKGFGFTGTHAHLRGDQQITNFISGIYSPMLLGEALESRACIERLWKKLHNTPPIQWIGRAGISHLALAAVDIALWDLYSKSERAPLWSVLSGGQSPPRLEAYNTDVGWLNIPLERLVAGCKQSIEDGFRGVKIKVGSAQPVHDVARIEAVRSAIGPDCKLMIDGNGKWSLETAQTAATELDKFGLQWFEEPLYFDDLTAHVALSKSMRTPIALGEQLYTKYHFDAFMEAGVVTFVQVDALRVAGVSEWLSVADNAQTHGLAVVPHVGDMMQVHQHVAFAHPSCSLLEYLPWTQHCFVEPARVTDGDFCLPQAPGAGTTLTSRALAQFSRPLS